MIAIGSIARFACPEDEGERAQRFTVLELNGDRALCEDVAPFAARCHNGDAGMRSVSVYLLSDLQPASEA